jgi:CRISPR-associated protein Cas1
MADEAGPLEAPELVPARMLNEHAYCPRLAYLEWVQGDFTDSADTVEGRFRHRRVEKEGGELPAAEEMQEGDRVHARSVMLSAPGEGLVARIDLVEAEGTAVTPVDYKKGEAPDLPEGAWEPERVQLCAQALVLEENGYRCEKGVLYFVASKQRVEIVFDDALRARTRELVADLRRTAAAGVIPPPLKDSPKCPRCSLVSVCLPDEVNLLREEEAEGEPRRLLPARDDALPLYVQAAGARVTKKDDELVVVERDGTRHAVRLGQTSQVALFGAAQVTTQALQALAGRGVPICYLSSGGWFYAITTGMQHKNVELRMLQHRAAQDPERSLELARRFIAAKLRNARTLVRRNAEEVPEERLRRLRYYVDEAERAGSAATLLGIEGSGAREYYEHFARMLKAADGAAPPAFDFEGRTRRPPRDRVNALLSFAYALLTKDLTLAVLAVGFDPYLGFYHRPRYGRPALALDLMEEFRPLIADSVVLTAVNTGAVKGDDFIERGGAVALTPAGRRRFVQVYERRMDELVTHPIFGYRIGYRRVLEVQARLLGRALAGEIPEYPAFCTR